MPLRARQELLVLVLVLVRWRIVRVPKVTALLALPLVALVRLFVRGMVRVRVAFAPRVIRARGTGGGRLLPNQAAHELSVGYGDILRISYNIRWLFG